MSSDSTSIFAGLDVSNKWVDICVFQGERGEARRLVRQPEALEELAQQLAARRVRSVVVEARGGLQRLVAAQLQSAGVAVINPKRIRDFAKAAGLLAKRLPAKAIRLIYD